MTHQCGKTSIQLDAPRHAYSCERCGGAFTYGLSYTRDAAELAKATKAGDDCACLQKDKHEGPCTCSHARKP